MWMPKGYRSPVLPAFWCATLVSAMAFGQNPPSIPLPRQPVEAAAAGQPAWINQPVVVNTFESVEKERLRLSEELAKMERDDADFREDVAKLQAKLAGLSLGMAPSSLPSEYRSFLSAKAGDIAQSDAYYALLKSCLNELTPNSPYQARLRGDSSSPLAASAKLEKLSEYREDDDICRAIQGHIASLSGGRVDDRRRLVEISKRLADLAKERSRLEWNLRMANGYSPLSGEARATEDERQYIRDQIAEVDNQVKELEAEKKGMSHLVTAAVRKLQFQQFIVELAVQQRYLHSLIACGFYRNSFKGGDLAISQDAYPKGRSPNSQQSGEDQIAAPASRREAGDSVSPSAPVAGLPQTAPGNIPPTAELPVISTISGLESFLLNRIRDAIKDREAMDSMLAEGQLSAAESLLRKMILTAKYQPELQTLPHEERQRIQQFSQNIRGLSDALNANDYAEISRLAVELEKNCSDAGTADLKVFAAEHPRKALHWANQADLAMKTGDHKTAVSLMEAAVRRAPLDPSVAEKIESLRKNSLEKNSVAEDLREVVRRQNYQEAFERMNEFLPLAASGDDPELKSKYEALLALEKSLRATFEKCDELERRGNHTEEWIALDTLNPAVAEDPRVNLRKSKLSGKCPRFVANYSSAVECESSGKRALALAWYLSALPDAPGNEQLQAKVTDLGNQLLKD